MRFLSKKESKCNNLRFNELSRQVEKAVYARLLLQSKTLDCKVFRRMQTGKGCQAKVSFMLLRGSYATVVLREIMKPSDL